MMSPLHHAFCGTHSLLMYCLYVCVSCLYACCVCSIEIIIMSHTKKSYLGSFLLTCKKHSGYEPS